MFDVKKAEELVKTGVVRQRPDEVYAEVYERAVRHLQRWDLYQQAKRNALDDDDEVTFLGFGD